MSLRCSCGAENVVSVTPHPQGTDVGWLMSCIPDPHGNRMNDRMENRTLMADTTDELGNFIPVWTCGSCGNHYSNTHDLVMHASMCNYRARERKANRVEPFTAVIERIRNAEGRAALTYGCRYCGERFVSSANLMRHQRVAHEQRRIRVETADGSQGFAGLISGTVIQITGNVITTPPEIMENLRLREVKPKPKPKEKKVTDTDIADSVVKATLGDKKKT